MILVSHRPGKHSSGCVGAVFRSARSMLCVAGHDDLHGGTLVGVAKDTEGSADPIDPLAHREQPEMALIGEIVREAGSVVGNAQDPPFGRRTSGGRARGCHRNDERRW